MGVDWTRKGIIAGTGFLDGYLVKQDQEMAVTDPTKRDTYLKKQSNWLRLGGTVVGTSMELFWPRYNWVMSPVADASLALLSHGLFFEITKGEGTVPIARRRQEVFVPRQRVSGSPQFVPPLGPLEPAPSGGVLMTPTSPRYE